MASLASENVIMTKRSFTNVNIASDTQMYIIFKSKYKSIINYISFNKEAVYMIYTKVVFV